MNRSKSLILGLVIILMVVLGYALYLHRGPMKRISDENKKMVAEIDQLKTASEKLKADYRSELDGKIQLIEELERKNAEQEEVVSRLKDEKHVTQSDAEKLQTTIAVLESSKETLGRNLEDLSRNLQDSTSQLEKLRKELETKNEEVAETTHEKQTMRKQMDLAARKLEALRKELEGKNEEVARATQENEAVRNRLDLLAQEREKLLQNKTELENQLAEQRSRLDAISDDLASRDRKIVEMEATHQSLLSQIDRQKKEKEELERLKDGLRNQLGMTQSQIESLSMATEAKEEQLKSKEKQLKSMEKAMEELSKQFDRQIREKEIQISALEDKLNIRLMDKILFASGSADVTPAGYRVLGSLATELRNMEGFEIAVSGHTDNVPLGPKIKEVYQDNLGLSVARAAAVSRVLRERGVNPENLSAAGHSMYRPVASNDNEEGRQQNRRVEIILAPLR